MDVEGVLLFNIYINIILYLFPGLQRDTLLQHIYLPEMNDLISTLTNHDIWLILTFLDLPIPLISFTCVSNRSSALLLYSPPFFYTSGIYFVLKCFSCLVLK